MTYRLGIDVGGTFTDFVLVDTAQGRTWTHKYLTTPHDPSEGMMLGLAELLRAADLTPSDVADAQIIHGTTLITNALIEGKGRRVALLTTRGARDVLETGKENRYDPYDRRLQRPEPLVPRQLRIEIDERIGPDGAVIQPLDRAAVAARLRELASQGVEGIAVCFLHAYRYPEHERQVREIVQELGLPFCVSLSSEVSPELGEYERVQTTVANTAVQPIVDRYLDRLGEQLREAGFRRGFSLMLSDGGIAAPQTARKLPIRLLESGPAAGALAAAYYARKLKRDRLIAYDMGGTTAKICLIDQGAPAKAASFEVGRVHRDKQGSGFPVKIPTVEMLEIGAGGGSLARVDGLGLLKVGPASAGADPGPACYGLGGTQPTVTDANLLLGKLRGGARLGRNVLLSPTLAEEAALSLANETGLDPTETVAGIRRVVTEQMAHAMKLHVTERGHDPRSYSLIAFGGAGPLHACAIARLLGIQEVIIPAGAGTLAAFGFVTAPPAVDLVRSFLSPLGQVEGAALATVAHELRDQAIGMLAESGLDEAEITCRFSLDMRYTGQGYEVSVPMPDSLLAGAALEPQALRQLFEERYRAAYGSLLGVEPEVRAIRLWAAGPTPEVPLNEYGPTGHDPRLGSRPAYFPEAGGWVETPVYSRRDLVGYGSVDGPALVEEAHTTIVVPPGARVEADPFLNLTVTIDPAVQIARRQVNQTGLSPVDLEIMLARLTCIMDEADATILKTAFSAVVREGKDYAVVLTDLKGNALALPTETMPLFVTSMPRTIGILAKLFPPESLSPGDVLVTNDAWHCAGHKSDLCVAMPIFYQGRPIAFAGAISHLPDVGGVIGDFRAWDLYEEGLQIPPMKLYEAGRKNETLFELLEANVRLPREVVGDVGALCAACNVTAARLTEFLADTGLPDLGLLSAEIGRRSVDSFRRAASRIPAGTYRYEHLADGLAPGGEPSPEPIRIVVTITSDGEGALTVDFTGTSPQIQRAPINVPIPYTLADTLYTLQYLLRPEISNVGPSYNLVDLIVPAGCILGAQPPVPVYARTRTGIHIATAIMGALAEALPDEVQAGCGHNVIMKVSGVGPDGQYFGVGLMPKGGMGGMAGEDGWSATVFPTNCTMIPTESFEAACGLLMTRELLPDSGGAGQFRGGLGQRVTMRSVNSTPVYVSVRSNYTAFPPPGLCGGQSGGPVRALLNGQPLPENPVTLRMGDLLTIETAGGGGFGDPLQRSVEAVLADVRAGYLTSEAALATYGVQVDLISGTAIRLQPVATL